MSTRQSGARVLSKAENEFVDDLVDFIDEDDDGMEVLMDLVAVKGEVYLATHECSFCHSTAQTIGVCHATHYCSYCEAKRGRKIEMDRKFERLEIEE